MKLCSPAAHLLLWEPVPNRQWSGTSLWPQGLGTPALDLSSLPLNPSHPIPTLHPAQTVLPCPIVDPRCWASQHRSCSTATDINPGPSLLLNATLLEKKSSLPHISFAFWTTLISSPTITAK